MGNSQSSISNTSELLRQMGQLPIDLQALITTLITAQGVKKVSDVQHETLYRLIQRLAMLHIMFFSAYMDIKRRYPDNGFRLFGYWNGGMGSFGGGGNMFDLKTEIPDEVIAYFGILISVLDESDMKSIETKLKENIDAQRKSPAMPARRYLPSPAEMPSSAEMSSPVEMSSLAELPSRQYSPSPAELPSRQYSPSRRYSPSSARLSAEDFPAFGSSVKVAGKSPTKKWSSVVMQSETKKPQYPVNDFPELPKQK